VASLMPGEKRLGTDGARFFNRVSPEPGGPARNIGRHLNNIKPFIMDMYEAWAKALKNTEILRARIQHLLTFDDTVVPYILLSESSINAGDTIARTGEVVVEKPSLILPPNHPQFEGFEFDPGRAPKGGLLNFLLIRGIQMPSLNYNNRTSSLDVYEGDLSKAVSYYLDHLQRKENVHTGLITGPEDCWQFSVLIYVCTQVARNSARDIASLLEEYRKEKNNG
jgi:hypothetical protein